LGRDVAIKTLPPVFAAYPERRARFEREARVLASLNHPNIATIYDLEEFEGVHVLVLEFIPGETVAERLSRGPVPLPEALAVCVQIADALETAHKKGIVHRDLKPANVKITPEGKVKVLDFGLAKSMQPEPAPVDTQDTTRIMDNTREGTILGTAAYMSPEQARGKPVDKRTDIWALGCLLFELLAGRRAFQGDTISDFVAAILSKDPEWDRTRGGMVVSGGGTRGSAPAGTASHRRLESVPILLGGLTAKALFRTRRRRQMNRKPIIGVMGGNKQAEAMATDARLVGAKVSLLGHILLTGGRCVDNSDVKNVSMVGAAEAELTSGTIARLIGIIPEKPRRWDDNHPNRLFLSTGLRSAERDPINAATPDVLIFFAGNSGTLCELSFAVQARKPRLFWNAAQALRSNYRLHAADKELDYLLDRALSACREPSSAQSVA
jgi:serine/threonine protein kinase